MLQSLLLLIGVALSQTAFGQNTRYIPVRSLQEIRTEGVVIQQWDNSCAAAALATVLSFAFGDPLSERDVAKGMLGRTDPDKVRARGGFSFLDMKRFVESRGYGGVGFGNLRVEDLQQHRDPILRIEAHGYPHFVVFRGVNGNQVRLADPSFGNRSMSLDRFHQVWRGGLAFVVLRHGR